MPFSVKKEVTSALRRLAPNGLSTDIVGPPNLRTLRHVIEMRTAPARQEELRAVFGVVGEMMRHEASGLFQDFTRAEDGSWVPGAPEGLRGSDTPRHAGVAAAAKATENARHQMTTEP